MSMTIEQIKAIKRPEDIRLRVLIYGESGTGKTRSAGTFPNPYFFDFDNGMLSLRKEILEGKVHGKSYTMDGRQSSSNNPWANFYRDWTALRKLKKEELQYQTYVFDSLTTINKMVLHHFQVVKGNLDKPPDQSQYGLAIDRCQKLLNQMLTFPANVVWTAHIREIKDEDTGRIKELPLVGGKYMPQELPLWFDEVFKADIVAKGDGFEPVWTVKHSRKSQAKSRLGIKAAQLEPTYPAYLTALKEVYDVEVNKPPV